MVPDEVVEVGDAGISVLGDGGGEGDGGGNVGEGREVGGKVDADGEGDEEGAAEEEHLVAAEVPAGHAHGEEEDDAGGEDAELDGAHHLIPKERGEG